MDATEFIDERIRQYKNDLPGHGDSFIIQKHLTFGEPYVIDRTSYMELKTRVANNFSIHPSEVIMVGSGKLGFSIAPEKRYNHFGESSDVDIAIICTQLFDEFWFAAFKYWETRADWPQGQKFKEFLFRGWIRPDMLPNTDRFPLRRQWWSFFQELTNSRRYGSYKINGALYKSWSFFEAYQSTSIHQCRRALRGQP